MPASLIFRFARESRRFIVSSGTRNARAISSVRSPPSARKVSATCASRPSEGWQQVKISSSRSSGNVVLLHLVLHGLGHLEQARLLGERAVAAQAVDRAVASRDRQPRARIRRRAVARPALGGDRERLLRGFLGEIEVAEEADQVGEDAAPLVAEDLLEQRLPLHQRTHLDRAAHPRGRDPRGNRERRIEIVHLDHDEAADVLLRVDERDRP